MPAAIVASKYEVFVNSQNPTLTFVSTPTANNVIVVFIANDKGETTNINTAGYTTIHSSISGNLSGTLGYKISNGTETGVQAGLFNTASDSQMFYCEISGLDSSSPLDASAQDATNISSTTTTQSSGSATAVAAAGIAIAAFAIDDSWNGRNTRSYTNSFTEIGSPVIDDFEPGSFVAKLNYSTTGAKSTVVTIGPTADEMFGCIALFKEPAAGGGRIMGSLADNGGLAGSGGLAGKHGGLAG